ncbi:hypothetical protein M422DRAFT_258244 [Sphaerobolus stellatus SS14]|uniref:Uncharacterized protein n=1 Tax=Sphaerobolus stellatus (strain SS14) TaxID=990650 RepID=A0A0C9UW42_SPHS4|nr:hypothetical protein M422DRAFT_258244 [Sphaerobolus stellatus SS14]
MVAQEFFIICLSHFCIGINGGFAPPTPSAIHTLVRSKDSHSQIVVNSSVRPDWQPSLGEAQSKHLNVDSHSPLIDELEFILKTIPVESPPGSQDIYGMDIGLAYGSDNLQWVNGGPTGCGQGYSENQATDEDKAKFKRAVEIINEILKQDA